MVMQKSFRNNKSKGFVLLFVMGSLILIVALFFGNIPRVARQSESDEVQTALSRLQTMP
jgi:competence protein ComGC